MAIDPRERSVVARIKVPTTHDAEDGVASGIRESLERLIAAGIDPARIAFVAHSTTQATNALLEGDLARVGILGLLDGSAPFARMQMRVEPFSPGERPFAPTSAFADAGDEGAQRECIALLQRDHGVEALVVTRAFGVDRSAGERRAAEMARAFDLPATTGSDASSLYGLRARTRTAALDAALLPRMLRAARSTERAVKAAGILAPLMVMRSDGGVMSIEEIERRPLATLLSGPAAGIAGALLHENVSDAIFIEVGGTSSDCSVIRSGRAQMRPGRIGAYRVLLRTLDVRTLGIAGGSLVRMKAGGVDAVGPRSAHIAGYRYAAFCSPEELRDARIVEGEILALHVPDGGEIAITPTCAANLLGDVPDGAFGRGTDETLRRAFALAGAAYGIAPEALAGAILDRAIERIVPTIRALIAEYELDERLLELVGGGGAARAIVPHLARAMNLRLRIARDHEVISPVGVALALVRDSIERQIVDPSVEQLARLRREVSDRAIESGADPASIEVDISVDPIRNRVLATAGGAVGGAVAARAQVGNEECARIAAASLGVAVEALESVEVSEEMRGFRHAQKLRIVDTSGVVRLATPFSRLVRARVAEIERYAREGIEAVTRFGDVGRRLPDLYALRRGRISELRGFADAERIVALLSDELRGCDGNERVTLVFVRAERL
ncbi:MAG: hydantoinase/oxoprolinase [Candidatus Eremiobacteraeota bacterium]|nr:hydantoinase/oxoprolinase [Candidatus Eremiobacteraeota bacterium]